MSQVSTSEKIDELIRLAESGDTRGLVDLVVRLHAAQQTPGWRKVTLIAYSPDGEMLGSHVVRSEV